MDLLLDKSRQTNSRQTTRLDTSFRDKATSRFTPFVPAQLLDIQSIISKFDLTETCIWSSAWLNELTVHQIPRSFTLVEVERESAEAVFYHIRDSGYKDVFLLLSKTDEALLDRYIFSADNPIIIRKIITKSPTQTLFDAFQKLSIAVPRLEKILVDVFCDDNLFRAYKGAEQFHIFENAFANYPLSIKTLLAYAQRRKKDTALRAYLHQYFPTEFKQNSE